MPNQLFDDRYAPILSEIGFLECDAKTAAEAFQEWQRPIQTNRGVLLESREMAGDLSAMINDLIPLTSVEARRFLFVPTVSSWVAYLDNGWRGADVFSTVSFLATKIGCRGIRAVSIPQTMRRAQAGDLGRFGAIVLEIYAADPNDCSFLNIRRSISVVNDGGRWRFDANGEPMNFEQLDRYNARQIRDRFTTEMLDQYLSNFGIHFFSPQFYNSPRPAYLISKEGPCSAGVREYSLDEARAKF